MSHQNAATHCKPVPKTLTTTIQRRKRKSRKRSSRIKLLWATMNRIIPRRIPKDEISWIMEDVVVQEIDYGSCSVLPHWTAFVCSFIIWECSALTKIKKRPTCQQYSSNNMVKKMRPLPALCHVRRRFFLIEKE